jgi:TPR repeat protein
MIREMSALAFVATLLFAAPAYAADYDAGLAAYESGKYDAALTEWQPLAESGDARAQFGLGMMYANGFGVEMNDGKALHWFKEAAAQDYAEAQYRIGVMHQNGWGVPMDDETAADWYMEAAKQGYTDAQVALGQVYAAEYCVRYDPVQAYKWFAIAAKLDDVDAAEKRDTIAKKLEPAELEQAKALVDEWFQDHQSLLASH